ARLLYPNRRSAFREHRSDSSAPPGHFPEWYGDLSVRVGSVKPARHLRWLSSAAPVIEEVVGSLTKDAIAGLTIQLKPGPIVWWLARFHHLDLGLAQCIGL